ncbi:ribonuclease H-like domain-containing protein [Mycena galericulata]|nr:ribonuclease H-like domain-containing protein [Mycena galericulata]
MDSTHFTLCDTASKLASATASLFGAATLFVDCEGTELGVRGGSLSLISLGTRTPYPHIFLIDVLSLGTSALRPIFELLESAAVRKVVFDGRMDQSALFYDHGGITLDNVVDLQLADVKSRALRGEEPGSDAQLGRLSPHYLPRKEVRTNLALYRGVHRLAGLERAIREHAVDVGKRQLKTKGQFVHTGWSSRPLPPKYLKYAANDIALIAALYSKFAVEGYIDACLPSQSARYAHMWTHDTHTQPMARDAYKLHALLPLNILDPPAAATDLRKSCIGCGRDLPQNCFSNGAWTTQDEKRKCLVCRAIGIREALRANDNKRGGKRVRRR